METENTTAPEPWVDSWSQINTFWYICRAEGNLALFSPTPNLQTADWLLPQLVFPTKETFQDSSEDKWRGKTETEYDTQSLSHHLSHSEWGLLFHYFCLSWERDKTSVVADTKSSSGPKENLFLQPITMLLSQNGQVALLIHKKRNLQKKQPSHMIMSFLPIM